MREQLFVPETIQTDLTDGLFHRVMLFFHRPTAWTRGVMASAVTALALFGGLVWGLISAEIWVGLLAFGLLATFFVADAVLLRTLPERAISFGNWRAQFFPLALPRTACLTLFGLVGPWLGWQWAFGLTLTMELIGSAVLYWATVIEPSRMDVTRLRMTSDRLSTGTPPIRLFHITDLHLENLTSREASILAAIEQLQPDLIVITGDYVSTSYNTNRQTFEQVRSFLRQLSAPYGVYATLGTPPVDLREFVVPLFEGLPVRLLREEVVELDLGRGRRLALMGMDCTHDIAHDAASLERMMAQVSAEIPHVLLYHSPELMPQAAEHGIDLYLCGHTHGGQVRLPLVGPLLTSSQLGRRYVMGEYVEGRTHLYVSRGVGFEGLSAPRVRFLAPPEVTAVTIRPA